MQQIETLYEEDNKQKKNKNNKEFILLIIVLLIITIICTIGLLKINNKKEEPPKVEEKDNLPKEENKKTADEIEEELHEKNYVYKRYSCEKEENSVSLDNGVKVRVEHRYEFSFNEGVSDDVEIGDYSVTYIFNNLNDYNRTNTLPISFEDSAYTEEENINSLTKTRVYNYILDYDGIKSSDFSAYLASLEKDNFVCTLVEKSQVINDYDVYYGRK